MTDFQDAGKPMARAGGAAEAVVRGLWRFDAGHALFADHFPGAPRVPGSCLLEAMRRAVEEAFPSRRVRAVRRARFRHFVLPDSDLLCRMEPEDRGDALPSEVRCRLLHGDACLAEAVFSLE